ncbi:hypothetical protein BD626DRAFT_273687 [Schizophyllum amplum]|uniref:Uncharacterized protein n=1 Tax=Schizophyllum amplum TaxID=97359 RepID=A0A550CFK8_9AGAR|nr:hypothetical protein BD626DRAFT_273687 [Auriculariopsis ampla]
MYSFSKVKRYIGDMLSVVFPSRTPSPAPSDRGEGGSTQATEHRPASIDSSSSDESDESDGPPRYRGYTTPGATSGNAQPSKKKPVCPAYNDKNGCTAGGCKMEHICSRCSGRHAVWQNLCPMPKKQSAR